VAFFQGRESTKRWRLPIGPEMQILTKSEQFEHKTIACIIIAQASQTWSTLLLPGTSRSVRSKLMAGSRRACCRLRSQIVYLASVRRGPGGRRVRAVFYKADTTVGRSDHMTADSSGGPIFVAQKVDLVSDCPLWPTSSAAVCIEDFSRER
jgi:hypothetical protein